LGGHWHLDCAAELLQADVFLPGRRHELLGRIVLVRLKFGLRVVLALRWDPLHRADDGGLCLVAVLVMTPVRAARQSSGRLLVLAQRRGPHSLRMVYFERRLRVALLLGHWAVLAASRRPLVAGAAQAVGGHDRSIGRGL
jgi:hypothetical protein